MAAATQATLTNSANQARAAFETELAGVSSRRTRELAVHVVVGLAAFTTILVSIGIVASLVYRAAQFVIGLNSPSEFDLEENKGPIGYADLWGDQWAPRFFDFDIKTLIVGSVIVTIIAMAVAAPLGLGAAIYLAEYASQRARKIIKPTIEILAGIPSVVLGFFALRWISPNVVQGVFPQAGSQSLIAAGLGVGLLTIPLVASISEDAMASVPDSLRQASAGLGARKKTTTLQVVLPAAISGLVAAMIVATSRAIGETMVVFLAAGASGNQAIFTVDPTEPGSTMTAAMAAQASGTDGTISELAFNSLFYVGFILFLITLALNLIADRYVRRVRQAY